MSAGTGLDFRSPPTSRCRSRPRQHDWADRPPAERRSRRDYAEQLAGQGGRVRTQQASSLSGGNQQKVVLGKWLATEPKMLILDEPTRGIDIGTKAEVHRIVSHLATQGMAIVLISSELPEVLAMSDRVLVMHEGRVTRNLPSVRSEPGERDVRSHRAARRAGEHRLRRTGRRTMSLSSRRRPRSNRSRTNGAATGRPVCRDRRPGA